MHLQRKPFGTNRLHLHDIPEIFSNVFILIISLLIIGERQYHATGVSVITEPLSEKKKSVKDTEISPS